MEFQTISHQTAMIMMHRCAALTVIVRVVDPSIDQTAIATVAQAVNARSGRLPVVYRERSGQPLVDHALCVPVLQAFVQRIDQQIAHELSALHVEDRQPVTAQHVRHAAEHRAPSAMHRHVKDQRGNGGTVEEAPHGGQGGQLAAGGAG